MRSALKSKFLKDLNLLVNHVAVFFVLTNTRRCVGFSLLRIFRKVLNLSAEVEAASDAKLGGTPWVVDGVTFPHGTEFQKIYKGELYTGKVEGGALVVNGKTYRSPSPAAVDITGGRVNGWRFCKCKRPQDTGFTLMERFRG